jgi:hypothetical protein
MHRPHSNIAIQRFRLAAFLLVGNCLLALVAIGLLVHSLVSYNFQVTVLGMGFTSLMLLLVIAQWIAAAGTRCPLCCTPVLAPMRCAKHRHARTLLGSHRLRVALGILFKNHFRCPYCHETTGLEAREVIHSSRPRRAQVD